MLGLDLALQIIHQTVSVTRLGDFWEFLVAIFLTKLAQNILPQRLFWEISLIKKKTTNTTFGQLLEKMENLFPVEMTIPTVQ